MLPEERRSKGEPGSSARVPTIRKIVRTDPWAGGLTFWSLALAVPLTYNLVRYGLNVLGLTSSPRNPQEMATRLLGMTILFLLPLLVALAVRVRAVRRTFREGERRPGTIVGFSGYQGLRVEAKYSFDDGTRARQASVRSFRPRLGRPNPLGRFAERDAVTVVIDPKNADRTFLAELYLEEEPPQDEGLRPSTRVVPS